MLILKIGHCMIKSVALFSNMTWLDWLLFEKGHNLFSILTLTLQSAGHHFFGPIIIPNIATK